MAVKNKFYYTMISMAVALAGFHSHASDMRSVKACVLARDTPLTRLNRLKYAECLGWQADGSIPLCHGNYTPIDMVSYDDNKAIHIKADEVSLYAAGESRLSGQVEVQQGQQVVEAETATIFRDEKTHEVTQIKLLGGVRYVEPGRLMIAKEAALNPKDKSGTIVDALYLFKMDHEKVLLPAWGRAGFIERLTNEDYFLRKVTYTTCAPQDKSWQIDAKQIKLYKAEERGVARDAVLRIADVPVLYTPYLSFPTSKKRKSGFLMPMYGYSNVTGFDFALPYYLNLAPNYDATVIPHFYTERGTMLGGNTRFLTRRSSGIIGGNFLPNDKAFAHFINQNEAQYPILQGQSTNRWSFFAREDTAFAENLNLNINYQQVSDDYYLQDFSSNVAVMTENQLLRQGLLTYTTDHWLYSGMLQSYQTLQPITQSSVLNIYERTPQLKADGSYMDLPLNAMFDLKSEFDNYRWPGDNLFQPYGPRYHLEPTLAFPNIKPWGYIKPAVQVVENYYDVHYNNEPMSNHFNRTIPRYSLDGGLVFERSVGWLSQGLTQTLEPRLYYLYVPYKDQTPVPVYDSAYMIFNYDQLYRNNRFSGIDRISDANQFAYGVTSRWLSDENGSELASFSVGQLRYFSNRRVQLCYQQAGSCVDSPLTLGYVSPISKYSPVASHAFYKMSNKWNVSGDYVWDVYTHSTNNGDVNFHYQPADNHILSFGYSYLSSGNLLIAGNTLVQTSPLNQATAAFSWPLTEQFSALGAYSYNLSVGYNMMSFLGVQYDNCCFAMRLMGGRAFQSVSPTTLLPVYNNNVYFQILLKGLGSVATTDPASIINTYLPGYKNLF